MRRAGGMAASYTSLTKPPFDFLHFLWQLRRKHLAAVGSHQDHILDSNPDALFRNVNARFDRYDHARGERFVRDRGVVHFEADVVAYPVREVFAKRLALQI